MINGLRLNQPHTMSNAPQTLFQLDIKDPIGVTDWRERFERYCERGVLTLQRK